MWRGLPSELPAGIDRVNYGSAGYPVITTPSHGAQSSIRGSLEAALRDADAELERALLESLETANSQRRLSHEERLDIFLSRCHCEQFAKT